MTRVAEEEFEGKEITRVYVAERVQEAEAVENLFDESAINYLIDIEEYAEPTFLTSPTKKGLVFYVLSGQADYCKSILTAKGMLAGIIDE